MVKVTCDSTCDLTRALYEKNDVRVIPLGVTMGSDFRRDGENVTCQELFDYVEKTGELPKTSAISVGEYEEVFREYVEQGDEVLHVNLSSSLSTSHQSACIAAGMVGNVWVVDSQSLSTGSGHLVLMARSLANAGMSAAQIKEILDQKKEKLDVSFIIQTLDFLHKGGRCSGVAAFGANLMKLRPEIIVENGKMVVGKKYRGNMEKTVLAYIRGRLEGRTDVDTSRIFITHSTIPPEIVEKTRELILELQPFAEVVETDAGSTISSHCGPNCLGVLFFKK